MDNAIILGGNALNIGVVNVLHSLGLNVIVVDYREDINLKCDRHIIFDAKDPEIAQVLRNQGVDNIKIVYTSMDNAGIAQRAICKEFGLLYAPEEAMINAHYKNKMHEVWQKAGLLNRISFSIRELDLKRIKELNLKYKIIIKPSDSCASRGITILDKNSSDNEIESAFKKALEATTNEFVNIEEFVDGTEFTVEMLGDNYGNVSVFGISKKYHTENTEKNKICNKSHYNPSDVEDETINKIAQFGIKCYKALGLKNTLGHLEILLKKDGTISPVEMGARSSGFIASHLAQVGTGKIFLEEFMQVLKGGKTFDGLLPQDNTTGMYYFYDMRDNLEVKNIGNITDFLNPNIKSVAFDRSNIKIGIKYSKLKQDTDRYGYEILIGDKKYLTVENVLDAENKLIKSLGDGVFA